MYLLAGDETVVPKSGDETSGLERFFSSTFGKAIPGLAFFALSIISVKKRRSYPMLMEQVVRGEATETAEKKGADVPKTSETKSKPGRPKGSKNRNKTDFFYVVCLPIFARVALSALATHLCDRPNRFPTARKLISTPSSNP